MKAFFLPSLFLGLSCTVAAFATETDLNTMSKDEWFGKLNETVPVLICKNFTSNTEVNKQLEKQEINYDKCITLIPASIDKCKGQYYATMPNTLDKDSAPIWGKTLGQCIGTDFAQTYLMPKSAESSNSMTDSKTMSKDEWLSKLKAAVPDLICKGFLEDKELNARLTKLKIDFSQCTTLIPASVDTCQTEYYASIPKVIDEETAGKWGHTIGECIGKDFAMKHLLPK